ncbi:type 1 glutamine amidotransferase family protein [Actinokineospora fastidiosa]|uniref:Protease YoaZ n=1 Tax=Actinokineospora fastidiosa TaxID=1816 RepID=A0A918GPS7_9PSEU|nr:type 1 glutamine amidotransferase family protein [Actinokineospora fastidiosa]GGS50464.1 putative protease YoaZ [Actinokineospora fastidiosa]
MTNAHLYVLDTMADWEVGHLIAELNTGRFFAEPGTALPVRTVGATRAPIRTMGGLTIAPDLAIDELAPQESALLILPGSEIWDAQEHAPAAAKAAEFLAAGVPVAAICGATVALAAAGLLDTRIHTSNDPNALAALAPNYLGAHLYRNEPAVVDGDLITASGVAPLEFARAVLSRLGVLSQPALDAWYGLFSTHEPHHFHALMAAVPQPA